MKRRTLIATFPALAFGAAHAQGTSGAWPTKTITLIAPTTPGTDGDIIARSVGQRMAQQLSATVIVDNKPGASGTLGVNVASRSSQDGHVVVITGTGPFILAPLMNKQLPYDMEKTLEPVSLMSTFASGVVVSGDSPYRTLGDLIAAAKAQPGKLGFASSGSGNLSHLLGELLKMRVGVDMLHVPYRAQGPQVQGVIAQETAVTIAPTATLVQLIKSGRLRALAVTNDTRMKSLPDVPTMAEAGVKDFVVRGWYGAYAPGGTPKALTQRFSAAMARALNAPDVIERFASLGMEVVGSTPEQLHATWKADTAVWAEVLKANPHIKIE